jgi:hypothetical protein
VDPTDLARWRLRNLRLTGSQPGRPEQVVAWLGAAQAQEYGPAKWSIGMRTRGAIEATVEQALVGGRILRTHVLRPTWHFVAAADIRWLQALTAPRVEAGNALRYRQLELDQRLLTRTDRLLADALEGGRQLTRRQIGDLLSRAGIDTTGQRLAYIVTHAELTALICSGAPAGKLQTYALLDERVPRGPSLPRDEALTELTVRYFTSHGPASARDFGWWSSLTQADIRAGLESAGRRLQQEIVDGVSYWFAPPSRRPPAPQPMIHLLPVYDELFVGYSQTRMVIDVVRRSSALAGAVSAVAGSVLLDGQLVGRWRRVEERRSQVIEVILAARLERDEREALHAAAERYAAFIDRPVELRTRQL